MGSVAGSGALEVAPTETTDYRLTCGASSRTVHLEVLLPVTITSFTATPSATIPDGVVHLTWTTEHADSCLFDGVGAVPTAGSHDATVTQDTTFSLSCSGFDGPVMAHASVTVTAPMSLDAPTHVAVANGDGELILSWNQAFGSSNVYVSNASGISVAGIGAMDGGVVFHKVASPFRLSGLINGYTYFARVTAASGALESDLSSEVSGTPRDTPGGADPYFAEQWHLVNTGQEGGTPGEDLNVTDAWASTGRGEGVRVAIADDGIDATHEDLRQNVVPQGGYDYLGSAPPGDAMHGTCVSGIVAARDLNNLGVRGVAPRAQLVVYNVLEDLTSLNEQDAMTRGKDRNVASNNSWGDAPDGTGQLTFPDMAWLAGVREGATQGRNGKGVVYLWASGNGGDQGDDSNYDGQANSRYVLAVSALSDDGKKTSYSEDGANVVVAAPGGDRGGHFVTTTDITGTLGYNDGHTPGEHRDVNYSASMDGTSAATPMTTGVVALIFQANSELTYRDVRRVLAYSAKKTDPSDPDWSVNGAGLHINHKYGFGVPDATAAVALARTFQVQAPEVNWVSAVITPGLQLPDNDGVSITSDLDVVGSSVGHVEFVEITVSVMHPRSADLLIELVKQGGATSRLHVPHQCSTDRQGVEHCSSLGSYTFGSVRHLDEPGDGRWSLRVTDATSGHVGRFVSWKLALHGRP